MAITMFLAHFDALTDATLDAVRVVLLDGGEQTQAWQWRNGEAAVICGCGERGREVRIVVRQGLRAGVPVVHRHAPGVGPLLSALLGVAVRVGMRRRRMGNGYQRAFARHARGKGRIWRWVERPRMEAQL